MSKLQPVRGTHDLLPDEFAKFFAIQNVAREIVAKYGFREMATPIFEFTEVFARTMGETSDVVTKEMYQFEDRGGESITLRPEFTAGIVRSFISNGLQRELPLKLFSTGPVFRYERPQKGRQRQFHQINVEWLGAQVWTSDIEVIMMANDLLKNLGITSTLHINSLGDSESRYSYREALVKYLEKYTNDLSDDSKIRLDKNPLRILDSKDEGDKKIVSQAPRLLDSLSADSKEKYNYIVEQLSMYKQLGFIDDFIQDDKLVRGLDYYNDVVFEFKSDSLGAQDTILAGGRYDSLVKKMGGIDTAAVGWGAGIERLMLLSNIAPELPKKIVVIAGSDRLRSQAHRIAYELRRKKKGLTVLVASQINISKALTYANKIAASEAYILGEDEAAKNCVTVKNLIDGSQKTLSISDINL